MPSLLPRTARTAAALLLSSAAALCLAACGAAPSAGGSVQLLPVVQDSEGGCYRIRVVGAEATFWHVDAAGNLLEPAVPPGVGTDYRVTTPGQFFAARDGGWWRLRDGQPEQRMPWYSETGARGGWRAAPTEPPTWLAHQFSFHRDPAVPEVPQSTLYQSVFVVGRYIDARGEMLEGRSTDRCFVLDDGMLLESDGIWQATDLAGRPDGRRYELLERQHKPMATRGRFLFVASDDREILEEAFWLDVELDDQEGVARLPRACTRRPLDLAAWDEVRFAERTRDDAPRIWLGRAPGAAGYVRLDRDLQPVRPDEPLLDRVVALHPGGTLGDEVRVRHELFRYVGESTWCLAVDDRIHSRDLPAPEIVPFRFRHVHADGSASDEEALGLVLPQPGGGFRMLGRVGAWWQDWGGTQDSISRVCAVAAEQISAHEFEKMRQSLASLERFREQQAEQARQRAEAERQAAEEARAQALARAEAARRAEAAEVVCNDCRGIGTWRDHVLEDGRDVIYEWGWLHESGNWVKRRTFDPARCPTCGGDGTAPEGVRRPLVRQPPDFRMFQTRWP